MIQPDWQSDNGDVQLYCGDCLAVLLELLDGCVDAVVTDPPYGMNYKSGKCASTSISSTKKRFSLRILGDDKPFDPSPWVQWPCAFSGAQWFYDRLPAGGSLHCWDKRGNYKPLDQADADMIWCSIRKQCRVFHLVWRGICRHTENRDKILHPTQKPVALAKWMLSMVGGNTILDPFMGSGTTGVACVKTGRKFIGIELEPKYFEISVARIKKALREQEEMLPMMAAKGA